MRTIAHISDLHFGTESEELVEGLASDLHRQAPDLVVVSGDLTQRARRNQFQAAANFLRRFSFPMLIVPGNHDIPLYDLLRRFFWPLVRYRKSICGELNPWFVDHEIAVLGLNTARSATWKSGRISWGQMELIRERFCRLPEERFRVLVTHHPFIPPPGESAAGIDLVGRAADALKVLDECQVDLLLAGHLHHGYMGDIRTFYPATRRSMVVVQAGTAISRRIRNEPNAYNLLVLKKDRLSIGIRAWREGRFSEASSVSYRLVDKEWRVET
jgi:3',5'-cyclic AMP phosphodiesterase CpdA